MCNNPLFEVLLQDSKVIGAILCDQIRTLDWQARNAEFISKCNDAVFKEVLEKLRH